MDELTASLLAAAAGDRVAFATALRLVQPDVWRLASHLAGADAAEEVTQDTLVRVWRALPSFRAESSGRTWVLSIARRACADSIRARIRRRRLTERLAAQRRAPATPDRSEAVGLSELVSRLDVGRKEAFVLTQVLGCSYADAAAVCDVPVGTIRSRVARAREDLLTALRDAEAV